MIQLINDLIQRDHRGTFTEFHINIGIINKKTFYNIICSVLFFFKYYYRFIII